MTKLLKGNQNNLTSLTCGVIYLIVLSLFGYVFCGGIKGLKQKYRTKKKKTTTPQPWDKQQVHDIRSEIFRMCSINLCGTGCIIILCYSLFSNLG